MQHDSLWSLAYSGMQIDDKHTGFLEEMAWAYYSLLVCF